MHYQRLARFHYRLQRGVRVKRAQCPQIHHFHADALAGELLRRLKAVVNHQPVGDDRYVVARALYVRLADGQGVFFVRHFAAHKPVCALVFQEYHGIFVAYGAFEQAFGVVWRGGGYDF